MVLTGKKLCTCYNLVKAGLMVTLRKNLYTCCILVKGRTDCHTEKETMHVLNLGKGQETSSELGENYTLGLSW